MITTRLTERLGIEHPVIQAPMAMAAGGELAAAVSSAGGLGLIGGGYGNEDWLAQQFDVAGSQRVGCGLITWSLAEKPHLLPLVLERKPSAMFLSFGDPAPFMAIIKDANVPVICQIQTLKDAMHAIDVGADIIVAQGTEAGGHGQKRATFTLVPEVADYIAANSPEVLLCAAGGIGDGRGLAAALMLGADGVVIGSRFWATREAAVHPNMHRAALEANGDQTIRSSVMDISRDLNWPSRYTAHVLQNEFTDRWHNDIEGLIEQAATESARWTSAWAAGDTNVANTFVGEVVGLVNSIEPAAALLHDIVAQAKKLLQTDF
ncbi:nitronate monooxygenase [Gammaproteobacteria bacterium]|nr:nitronate monooxygenase [Gammaproteobacteria bacterium]